MNPTEEKFKNKYRTKSARLAGYDYSQNGAYFITICTANRECIFGEIVNGEMILNKMGEIAFYEWENTENIRPNITIDKFVVMPNHVHGIVCIDYQIGTKNPHQIEQFSKPTKNSIPTIIRSYKATVTKQINEYRKTPQQKIWQPQYYDRIIRNENELNRIREYIVFNPQKWEQDP